MVKTSLVIVGCRHTFCHKRTAMIFLFHCSTWLYDQAVIKNFTEYKNFFTSKQGLCKKGVKSTVKNGMIIAILIKKNTLLQ